MDTKDTYTVAVSTQKGGAGKTTIATNVAGALANRGYPTALVDLDPQGHATEGLGREGIYDSDPPTTRDLLTGEKETTFREVAVHAGQDNVALLPAHASMAARPRLEHVLEADVEETAAAVDRLTTAIDESKAEFAILDCPPSLGALTDVGMLSAGRILVPAKASGTSMRALELLLSKKKALESEFDVAPIAPIGVVANEVRRSGVSDQLTEWLDETFSANVPVWQLRKRVALERAWMAGATVYNHDENVPHAREIFDSIADHLESKP